MKLVGLKNCLLPLFIFTFLVSSYSQGVTGIWRGYFIADNGYQYKLEFQVKQNSDYAVSGVSYSWQDDIRFYGKATMTGNFIHSSKNFRIREIKTVEVRSAGGGTCIMNYDLQYIRSGKEEFLEGSYLGKQEVASGPNPYEWGDCGGGKVYLRKVTTSEFYIEPALRPRIPETKKESPPIAKKTTPPATKKPVTSTPKTPPVKEESRVTVEKKKENQPEVKRDTIRKIPTDIAKIPAKEFNVTPTLLKTRENKLAQTLTITDPDVTVKIYDNGEIDDDTISVFLNKKLILSHQRLTASPLILKFKMDEDNSEQELTMVAENLGRIPPNTSLMIVQAGDQKFEVRITSTEQKNAVVRFRYKKPDQD